MEKEKSKQLTIDGLIKYNQEVLITVFENRVCGIDKKLDGLDRKLDGLDRKFNIKIDSFKKEFVNFKKETLTTLDKVLNKLDILIDEKDVGKHQDKRKKKFYGYVVKHMETGETSKEELAEIAKLNVL